MKLMRRRSHLSVIKSSLAPRAFIVVILFAFLALTWFASGIFLRRYYEAKLRRVGRYSDVSCIAAGSDRRVEMRPKRLLLLGDSRIAQWPSQVGITGFETIVSGKGGETTFELCARLQNEIRLAQPEFIIIQIGINDIVAACGSKINSGIILKTACERVGYMTRWLASLGIRVLVTEIIPPADSCARRVFLWGFNIDRYTDLCNQLIRSLCADNGVQWIPVPPAFLRSGKLSAEVANGGLHLSAKGYQVWAKHIELHLVPISE